MMISKTQHTKPVLKVRNCLLGSNFDSANYLNSLAVDKNITEILSVLNIRNY